MKYPVPKPKKPMATGTKGELANVNTWASICGLTLAHGECTLYSSQKKDGQRINRTTDPSLKRLGSGLLGSSTFDQKRQHLGTVQIPTRYQPADTRDFVEFSY